MRAFFYGPNGEQEIFTSMEDVPEGWRDHPFEPDPLDHDGDGRKGGSTSAAEDAKAEVQRLRAEYRAKLNKKPFPGWDVDELRRRMAEA